MYLPWVPSKNSIALNRCRALKKSDCLRRDFGRETISPPYFSPSIALSPFSFPHLVNHKETVAAILFVKLHSLLLFFFENSIKEPKVIGGRGKLKLIWLNVKKKL